MRHEISRDHFLNAVELARNATNQHASLRFSVLTVSPLVVAVEMHFFPVFHVFRRHSSQFTAYA